MTFFSTARRWACWLGLAGITAMPALANTAGQVQQFTLENGMQILVLEDHSIPNANMYLFWKVGSRNEAPGITGISHFFEHMMFNGSKKYGPKMFDQVMGAAGGANNAYNTENITVYTNWIPQTKRKQTPTSVAVTQWLPSAPTGGLAAAVLGPYNTGRRILETKLWIFISMMCSSLSKLLRKIGHITETILDSLSMKYLKRTLF